MSNISNIQIPLPQRDSTFSLRLDGMFSLSKALCCKFATVSLMDRQSFANNKELNNIVSHRKNQDLIGESINNYGSYPI